MKGEDVNFPRPDVTVGHYITLTVPFPFSKPFFTTHHIQECLRNGKLLTCIIFFSLPV